MSDFNALASKLFIAIVEDENVVARLLENEEATALAVKHALRAAEQFCAALNKRNEEVHGVVYPIKSDLTTR